MASHSPIDDLTIRRAKNGDRDAWTVIYEVMGGRLMGFLVMRLGSRDDAAEALSETFARALARIGSLRTTTFEAFRGWIYQIARNTATDRLRFRMRETPVETVPDQSRPDQSRPDQSGSAQSHMTEDPLAALVRGESHAAVRAAFAGLSEPDREVLYLRVIVGLASDAVASILGTTPGAVRMRQMRALESIGARLDR